MPGDLTIEQLAAETEMSVRNIRAHQARGLLASPEIRLRVGYYGPEHVTRLNLIRDLQADGFNLAGIKQLLDDAPGATSRLHRFREALGKTAAAERPETLSLAELGRRFRVDTVQAAHVLARAERLGILVPAGEAGEAGPNLVLAPNPGLLAVAERVVSRGVSLDAALAVFEQIERHCNAVSAAFVGLFMTEVWEPFEAAGMPVERWHDIDAAIAELRPLAAEALQAMFSPRMGAEIESAFGELTRRPPAE